MAGANLLNVVPVYCTLYSRIHLADFLFVVCAVNEETLCFFMSYYSGIPHRTTPSLPPPMSAGLPLRSLPLSTICVVGRVGKKTFF